MLLEGYETFLRGLGKGESATLIAYRNFATEVGHNPSKGPEDSTKHYRTWKPVLDEYQEQHGLERVSWFQ